MNIPSTLRAGDTITWDESFPTIGDDSYKASAGWTLAFILYAYGKTPITITASADGDDYAISVPASTTRSWVAGTYSWQSYVYDMAGTTSIVEKYTLYSGSIIIQPDLTQATSATDNRSHVKKVLDALEAVIEGKASSDALSYSIGGRSISKMNPEEIIKWRSFYLTEYQRELDAEASTRGEDSPRRIGIRFRRL